MLKQWNEILKVLKYLKILNEFDIIKRGTFERYKRKARIMKKYKIIGVLASLVLGMTACGTGKDLVGDALMNSVSIAKDGSIESMIVEDFTESYYNVEDLNQMIQSTISDYQKVAPESVISIEACEMVDQKVKVVLKYNDAAAYTGYNSELLFVGTIQEAYEAGYDLNMTLTGTDKEATQISRQELLNMGENHIFIMENVLKEGTLRVNCYDNILYTGNGVTAIAKKKADIEPTDGYSVIIFK